MTDHTHRVMIPSVSISTLASYVPVRMYDVEMLPI